MKKILAAAAVVAVFTGGSALAADIPLKAPARAPAPAVESWTGGYVGGEVGALWSQADWTTTCLLTNAPGDTTCPSALSPSDSTSPHRFNGTALRAGGFFGFNWQVQPSWLVGVEIDAAWADHTEKVTGIVGCSNLANPCGLGSPVPASAIAGDSTSVRTRMDASARARLGFLVMPNLLAYGTAGFAIQEVEYNVTCDTTLSPWCGGVGVISSTVHDLLPGWTAGGGLEYKFGAWSVRGEYRYSDYQTGHPRLFEHTSNEIRADVHMRTQTAMFGLAYGFNTPAPAVAAKY